MTEEEKALEERLKSIIGERDTAIMMRLFDEQGNNLRFINDVAKEFAVSNSRISQIRNRCLERLRHEAMKGCPILCRFLNFVPEPPPIPPEPPEPIPLDKKIELVKHYDSVREFMLRSSMIMVQLQRELVPIGLSLQDAIRSNVSNPYSKPFLENLAARFNVLWHKIENIEDRINTEKNRAEVITW